MKRPKVIIVGAGAFAHYSLEAYTKYLKGVNFIGIHDLAKEQAISLAAEFKIPYVAHSYRELLELPSDVVVIATPPDQHYSLAKQALLARKHVFMEKPIAFTFEQAEELIQIARENGLQIASNFVLRFHPFHLKLRELQASGKYGRLRQISTSALLAEYPTDHWYWKKEISGGFFLNTFCHFLDLYDYVLDSQIEEIFATGDDDHGYNLISRFPNGEITNLAANLHITNEQETVTTKYIFEHAVIVTEGWLPRKMTIISPSGDQHVILCAPKKILYQKIMGRIFEELINRINNPDDSYILTNESLMNSVKESLKASNLNRHLY